MCDPQNFIIFNKFQPMIMFATFLIKCRFEEFFFWAFTFRVLLRSTLKSPVKAIKREFLLKIVNIYIFNFGLVLNN